MQTKKYNFLTNEINQMNMNFLIKIATLTSSVTMVEELKVTTERIERQLHEIDLKFSPFRYDSLVSRFQRGDQTPLTSSDDFKNIYNSAILSEQMTNGTYHPYFAGQFDPSVIVKAWAIERVFDESLKPLLSNPEVVGVYLSADGDSKFATKMNSDFRWTIKVPNTETDEALTTYYLKNGAISTFNNDGFGNSSSLEEFMYFIAYYNLTGILVDKNEQVINFNLGTVIDNQEIA